MSMMWKWGDGRNCKGRYLKVSSLLLVAVLTPELENVRRCPGWVVGGSSVGCVFWEARFYLISEMSFPHSTLAVEDGVGCQI